MDEDQGNVLREAAGCGDHQKIKELLQEESSLINSQHSINGWSALHWAAKRNQLSIVMLLLEHGANKSLQASDTKLAAELTTDSKIAEVLGGVVDESMADGQDGDEFVPSYLANPTAPTYSCPVKSPTSEQHSEALSQVTPETNMSVEIPESAAVASPESELVLKARRAHRYERDFIEIELDNSNRTFAALLNVLCTELKVSVGSILKIRKLPNTILRKDKDVARLKDFQELEVVADSDMEYQDELDEPSQSDHQKSTSVHSSSYLGEPPVY